MSCEDCSKEQEDRAWVMPIRVGTANLLVLGCRKHCSELLNRLDLLRNLQNWVRESPGIPPAEKETIKQRFGL